MKPVLILLAAALVCAADDKIEITRDGHLWKVTVTRGFPAQRLVSIATAGDVTVRGTHSPEIRYTITRNVLATEEAVVRGLAGLVHADLAGGQLIYTQPGAMRIEIPRHSRAIAVSSALGTIDVSDLEGSLRADAMAGRVVVDRIGGDVEIRSGGGETLLGSIGGAVHCQSGGGSIRAVRVRGEAFFATNGGDIQLGEMLSTVRAFTGAGGIRIDHASAHVVAETLGGPIEISGARSAQCRSAGGSIRLNDISGPVQAVTEYGSIVAGLPGLSAVQDSILSARSGDITVVLPSKMGVTIFAQVTATASDAIPIRSEISGLNVVMGRFGVTASGNINGGGPVLRLTDVGGRIEIKRK